MTGGADERYVVISADCHAGGSMDTYREYLEDEVPRASSTRGGRAYTQPVPRPAGQRPQPQLGQRPPHRRARGRRPGRRGHLPEHRAAVLPDRRAGRPSADPTTTSSCAGPACAPTTAGWPTGARDESDRRAGIAQVFLNDVDAAVAEARGSPRARPARAACSSPRVPDDSDIDPLYSDDLRPAVGGRAKSSAWS